MAKVAKPSTTTCSVLHPQAKLIKLVKSSYLFIKNPTIVALSAYITKQIFSSTFNDFHRNQLNKNTLDLIFQARFTILAFNLLVIRHHTFQVVLRLAKISILHLFNSISHIFLRINQPVAAGDGPLPFLLPRFHNIHVIE
ncbi:hypothetical protein PVAP13_5NG421740, partial [Panicum virgatum]